MPDFYNNPGLSEPTRRFCYDPRLSLIHHLLTEKDGDSLCKAADRLI